MKNKIPNPTSVAKVVTTVVSNMTVVFISGMGSPGGGSSGSSSGREKVTLRGMGR